MKASVEIDWFFCPCKPSGSSSAISRAQYINQGPLNKAKKHHLMQQQFSFELCYKQYSIWLICKVRAELFYRSFWKTN